MKNLIKNKWEDYASQYPYRWQWWISGFIYGIFFGKLYAEIKQTHETWNAITFEQLTWWDATLLTFDLKWVLLDEDEVTMWLLDHGYTFPSNHTAFCDNEHCYCPNPQPRHSISTLEVVECPECGHTLNNCFCEEVTSDA